MDALAKAHEHMERAEQLEGNAYQIAWASGYAQIAQAEAATAQVAATHAQTEQLRRIADALYGMADAAGPPWMDRLAHAT